MLKPICYSGSVKVPEYLETDKEKNVGRTPLSSDIQQVKNVVEDVPPFPESGAVSGSVSAAGNDSNLLIVFYVQIMPDDFVMQLHR
ncbi:hypothetical protein NSP16_19960, partial [Salmonella enterica]|nr:hypothetical protein [Salmonella enterica]MCR2728192.1 hypothetical protein [Salmonella enterica]